MKSRLILLVSLLTSFAYSQQALPEEFLSFSVLIKLSNGGAASGFYYTDSTDFYLVTAKHVFFQGAENQLKSESADLISYPRNPYQESYNLLRCDLKMLVDSSLVRYHPVFDVAVAKIGRLRIQDTVVAFIDYNSAITKPDPKHSRVNEFSKPFVMSGRDVPVGTEVHMFGYPSSIGIKQTPQFDANQPLLRRGIVAGKNYKQNTLILDCPAYKGNSGGPVVASLFDGDTTKYRLIGIVSEFIPFEEKWTNDKYGYANVTYSNSGYSVVAPIETMLELIKEMK